VAWGRWPTLGFPSPRFNLLASYRTNRQLSGQNPPLLMVRAFGAHGQFRTSLTKHVTSFAILGAVFGLSPSKREVEMTEAPVKRRNDERSHLRGACPHGSLKEEEHEWLRKSIATCWL
jgi:hypothetical protein